MKKVTLALIVLVFATMPEPATAQQKAKPARPSLDLLVSRVEAYWKLMSAGKREQAAAYVTSVDREKFLSAKSPQFRAPRIKTIELGDSRNEIHVTVSVKRIVPPVSIEMETPIKEKWRFEKGSWYRRFDPQSLPLFAVGKLNQQQMEAVKQDLRKKLQFAQTEFDFGVVNQGKNVTLTVNYVLTGTGPVPITLKSTAPGSDCADCTRERGISLLEPKNSILTPSRRGKLLIEVPTWNYDGPVDEKFVITADAGNSVRVPYEFTVQGEVYTPITVMPKMMRFAKGEREKEISIRNNSESDLRLEKAISETGAVTIESLPATIPPGEQLRLKMKTAEAADSLLPGTVDRMAITYAPIDGFSALSYKVHLNTVEEQNQVPAGPTGDPRIQEMLRQNPIVIPGR